MKRADLELAIRAAGAIVRNDHVLVIGSQAILGTFTEDQLPAAATFSREADIAPFRDDEPESLATAIDVHLGEWSDFDDANGFYVQGVSRNTAVLPPGWQERLVPLPGGEHTNTIGLCLEPHDLCARNSPGTSRKTVSLSPRSFTPG